jgi:hypothetical protein
MGFLAFDAGAVAKTMFLPAQEAVRNRDLGAWQKVYDSLNRCHLPYGDRTIIENLSSLKPKLSRDEVPDEPNWVLQMALRDYLWLASSHRMRSRMQIVRTWLLHRIAWKEMLISDEELAELELFQKEAWAPTVHPPDPFWCLASSNITHCNYIEPNKVVRLAEVEMRVGLFRRLALCPDLGDFRKGGRRDGEDEVKPFVSEAAAEALLVQVAARSGLAIYFSELNHEEQPL